MWFALVALAVSPLLSASQQDHVDWPAIARDHEWEGRFDEAIIAWTRSLLDADGEQSRRELSRLTKWNRALRFVLRVPAPDGTGHLWAPHVDARAGKIVTAWRDLRVWSEDDGRLLSEPIKLSFEPSGVYLDPTGRRVAVTDRQGGVATVYDVATGRILLASVGGESFVIWGPAGERLAMSPVGDDGSERVRVWEISTGDRVFSVPTGWWSPGPNIRFSHDGNLLAWIGLLEGEDDEGAWSSFEFWVHDVRTGELIASGPAGGFDQLRFHPAESRLIVHRRDGLGFHELDVEVGSWARDSLCGLGYVGQDGDFVSDDAGERWTVANQSQVASVWRSDGRPAGLPLLADGLRDEHISDFGEHRFGLSPRGDLFVAAGISNTVRVWDTVSGERLGPTLHAGAKVTFACITRAGSVVAAVADGTVRVWSVSELEPVRVAADRDNEKIFAPGGAGAGLRFLTRGHIEIVAAPGRVVSQAKAPAPLGRLAVSADGSRLAGEGLAFGLWTWDLTADDPAVAPQHITDWDRAGLIALDGSGEQFVAAGRNAAYVWDAANGALLGQVSMRQWVEDLALDTVGSLWVLGSWGVGKIPGGVDLATDATVTAVALSRDGGSTVSCRTEDGRVDWHMGGEIIAGIEQLVLGSQRVEISEWLTSASRAVAVHPSSATILDPSAGRVIGVVELTAPIAGAALDGDRLVLWGGQSLRLFDAATGDQIVEYRASGPILAACGIPGTDRVACSSTTCEVGGIDVLTGERFGPWLELPVRPEALVHGVKGGTVLLLASGRVLHLDPATGKQRDLDARSRAGISMLKANLDAATESFPKGPGGLVLLDGQRLERIDDNGLHHRIGVRRWTRDATFWTYYGDFGGGPAFLDDRRILIHGRATPDGVEPVVLDFGPATAEPIVGAPGELLSEWSERLGLRAAPDGTVVPAVRR